MPAGPDVIQSGGPYCGPAPVPEDILLRWNLDPIVLALLLSLAFVFRKNGRGLAATVVLVVAFVSPLCALSSALFAARVLHHVLLVAVASPLLACAVPARTPTPVGLTFLLATAALWLWHLPAAYDAALTQDGLYWLMQVSLLVPAFAFWRAVRSQPAGAALGWVFLAYLAMGMLGAILTLAPQGLYSTHAVAPMLWGFTPLADQQLGGLIMWMPAALPYAVWGALVARRAWRAMEAAA